MNLSITMAYKDLNFCLLSLQTRMDGAMSQAFYFGLSFYFMPKIGNQYVKFEKNSFSKSHKIKTRA